MPTPLARSWLVLALACGLVLGPSSARPARADDAAEAKVHYQKATAHFAVGEYSDAAAEYEAAYKLKQDPAILFNAAQAHRLAGNGPKALLLYNNIIKLYPSSRYASDAKERISKIEPPARAASSPATSSPGVPAPVQPLPPSETSTPPATGPSATPPVLAPAPAAAATTPTAPAPAGSASPPTAVAETLTTASSPPAERQSAKPIYARWWFWAAAAGVVAIGVVAVVALSSSKSGTSDPFSTNLPAISGGIVHW